MDTFSLSDPMVVAYLRSGSKGVWTEIGRTEVIWDNLNPKFATSITARYYFERSQEHRAGLEFCGQERSFRGYQSGQHTVISGTHIIAALYRYCV